MSHRSAVIAVEQEAPGSPATWWIGIVHAADGIRFIALGPTREVMVRRLADYVREHAPHHLGPENAGRIAGLLSGGAWEVAVGLYFATVGSQWDEEWLHTQSISIPMDPHGPGEETAELCGLPPVQH
jgi:hypothetical protein